MLTNAKIVVGIKTSWTGGIALGMLADRHDLEALWEAKINVLPRQEHDLQSLGNHERPERPAQGHRFGYCLNGFRND